MTINKTKQNPNVQKGLKLLDIHYIVRNNFISYNKSLDV